MRIGILGGTFNPVHNAHLSIAKAALKKFSLNKVLFIPAYIPPHKKIKGNAKTKDRISMLRLALRGERRFGISLYEVKKKGVSYSIDTLKYFKKKYGKRTDLFFLIGSDSLNEIKTWKNPRELVRLAHLAVASRPGSPLRRGAPEALYIKMIRKDISSSDIRNRIKKGKSVKNLVPTRTAGYIHAKGLYR